MLSPPITCKHFIWQHLINLMNLLASVKSLLMALLKYSYKPNYFDARLGVQILYLLYMETSALFKLFESKKGKVHSEDQKSSAFT